MEAVAAKKAETKMVKVKLMSPIYIDGKLEKEGSEVLVSEDRAKELLTPIEKHHSHTGYRAATDAPRHIAVRAVRV